MFNDDHAKHQSRTTVEFDFDNKLNDPAKEKEIIGSIMLTLRKLLRKHASYLGIRDEVACDTFLKNTEQYLIISPHLL